MTDVTDRSGTGRIARLRRAVAAGASPGFQRENIGSVALDAAIGRRLICCGSTEKLLLQKPDAIPDLTTKPMILSIDIPSNRSVSTPFELPLLFGPTSVAAVDWGDLSSIQIYYSAPVKHTYTEPGSYNVTIYGNINGYGFTLDTLDEIKTGFIPQLPQGVDLITSVKQWGDIGVSTLIAAFVGAKNLTTVPSDLPKGVVNTALMFAEASHMNAEISAWDVSLVTDMTGMFNNANSFNADLSKWNVGNVISMKSMFEAAIAFNPAILNWNVSRVADMSYMFRGATLFNADLRGWDVRSVTNMVNMFSGAEGFNQSLNSWIPRSVTDASSMFVLCPTGTDVAKYPQFPPNLPAAGDPYYTTNLLS